MTLSKEELARFPTTVRNLYDTIDKQRRALEAITKYGYAHPGCGYTCASMAEETLQDIDKTKR